MDAKITRTIFAWPAMDFDVDDNDFVIGLMGAELYPLSRIVQDMRKTQQTALYIESLGPFFVGKKV